MCWNVNCFFLYLASVIKTKINFSMRILVLFFVSALLLLCSCDKHPAQETNTRKDIQLTKAQEAMVSGNNGFAFDLYRNIADGSSFFISPLSAAFELSILANGVAGDARDEILAALGLGDNDISDFNAFAQMMRTRLLEIDKTSEINISNAVVSNSRLGALKNDFKNICSGYYGCDVTEMDFAGGKAVLDYVNDFCSRSTSGKITEILDHVSNDDVMYALNAVYFKGKWAVPFITGDTHKAAFSCSDGSQTGVDMMHVTDFFAYTELSGVKAIVLPYGNSAFRMTVIVSDGMPDIAGWDKINSSLQDAYVDFRMPKFEVSQKLQMEDALKSAGIRMLFTHDADFSPMIDAEEMNVSGIKQVSKFRIDEKGCEAASVSINDAPTSPGVQVKFTVDKPFCYVISEISTGAILFMGYFSGR